MDGTVVVGSPFEKATTTKPELADNSTRPLATRRPHSETPATTSSFYEQAFMAKQWRPADDDFDDWSEGSSDDNSDEPDDRFADGSGDEYDADLHDETLTVECSKCGCDMYEDAEQCPLCGEWRATRDTSVWARRPGWFILGGLVGIIAVVLNLLYFAFLGFNSL